MFARSNPVTDYNRQPTIRQQGVASPTSMDRYTPNRLGAGSPSRLGFQDIGINQRSMSYGMRARRNTDPPAVPEITEEDALPLRFVKKDETTMSTALVVVLVIALVGLGGLSLWLLMKKKK